MTDRDDSNGKTGNGKDKVENEERDAPRAEEVKAPWQQLFGPDREPQSELEADVKKRFEEAATVIIQERLGVPLNDEGTPDVSGVTQEQLDGSMPDLALEMLSAYVKAIKAATRAQAGEEDAPDDDTDMFEELAANVDGAEFLNKAAEDIRVVLSFFGERKEDFTDAFEDIASRVTEVISDQLGEVLSAVKTAQSKVLPGLTSRDSIQSLLGDKLIGLVRKFGDVVDASKVPPSEFVARAKSADQPSTSERPIANDAEDDGVLVPDDVSDEDGYDDFTKGEVIILDEVRKRLEEKRQKIEGLPDILGKFLINAAGEQKDGGVNINLDQDFFKEHGAALFKQLVETVSSTLGAPKLELTLPMASDEAGAIKDTSTSVEAASADEGGEGAADKSAVKVKVNLDLGNILGRIFKTKETKPDET